MTSTCEIIHKLLHKEAKKKGSWNELPKGTRLKIKRLNFLILRTKALIVDSRRRL